jgi:hypothetical protein
MRPSEGKFSPTGPGDLEITPMVERAIPLTTSVGSPSIHGEHPTHPTNPPHPPHLAPHRVPPPGLSERAIPLPALVDGVATFEASQEFHPSSVHSTYGPHSAKMTHPLHTPHSTDGSHSAKSTHGDHSAHFTSPGGHPTWTGNSGDPIATLPGSVSHLIPIDELLKREAREKTPTPITFNPSTLPTMSTITLAAGIECITTMYLPHYPSNGPKTKTIWTLTSTLYPEFDCHGCASLTTVDPWTMGQPTTHYHHTKTIKSVITVESPVCKPTSTL